MTARLSRSAATVLRVLRQSDHRMPTSDIRHFTGLDAGQIIGATIDLEEHGLIEVSREGTRWFYRANQAGREVAL
jgi:DNA-binding PadR family transcriptional regulator